MESWSGNRYYQVCHPAKQARASEINIVPRQNTALEVQLELLKYKGVTWRLLVVRNADYIMQQQQHRRCLEERKMSSSLSNELIVSHYVQPGSPASPFQNEENSRTLLNGKSEEMAARKHSFVGADPERC